jgi:hypothetical protein
VFPVRWELYFGMLFIRISDVKALTGYPNFTFRSVNMKQGPGIYMMMMKSETVQYLHHHYLIYGVIECSLRCKYHEVYRSGHSS